MTKPYHKPNTSIDQAEIIPLLTNTTCLTHTEAKPPAKRETAEDYLWLIKLADMKGNPKAIKEIYAEVLYQRKKAYGENPADYIAPLMRILRDDHQCFYLKAKRFIEKKYDECFPGQSPVVTESVMKRLQALAEGGAV